MKNAICFSFVFVVLIYPYFTENTIKQTKSTYMLKSPETVKRNLWGHKQNASCRKFNREEDSSGRVHSSRGVFTPTVSCTSRHIVVSECQYPVRPWCFQLFTETTSFGWDFPCNADVWDWPSCYWDTVNWRGKMRAIVINGPHHWWVHVLFYVLIPMKSTNSEDEDNECNNFKQRVNGVTCRWTRLLCCTSVPRWPPPPCLLKRGVPS